MLAKVYLTLSRYNEAIPLLRDVINLVIYGSFTSYADVFKGNQ